MKQRARCPLPRGVNSGIKVSHLEPLTSLLRVHLGLNEHPVGSAIIDGG
jgi:hypothetical protein